MTKATFYVQFKPEIAYGTVRTARAVRMTQRPPESIEGLRVAVVKFVVTLPDVVFDPFLAEVDVATSDVQIVTETDESEDSGEAAA